jgi:hypothetical protein
MIAMVVACCVPCGQVAVAQVYAPVPTAGYQAPPEGQSASAGNPFWRRGPMRSSALAVPFDDRVMPASYEQSLPNGPPTPAPAMPVATPTPSVAPPANFAPTPAALPAMNLAAAANPLIAPPPAVEPPRPLSGIALLTERPLVAEGRPPEHPLMPVVRWAEFALQQTQGLSDYTGTFTKREWVDGRLRDQEVMFAKVRQQPFSVYLQFLAPSDVKGQEALYVAGQNQGNMLAHPVGLKQAIVGTISLSPTDPRAMEGNRHPITDFGVRRLLERYLEGCVQESQFGECDVRIIENARVNDRSCTCVQVSHPTPRREFKYHLTRLYVDNEWNLPIRYESYDWPRRQGDMPQLLEEYTFQGLTLNPGLGDADFHPKNPNYRF